MPYILDAPQQENSERYAFRLETRHLTHDVQVATTHGGSQRRLLAYNTNRGNPFLPAQVADQAREYQARRVVQLERQQEQDRRVAASYLLDENQQCANGIVIDRRGSTFTQARGRDGGPIRCQGDKALEPLR